MPTRGKASKETANYRHGEPGKRCVLCSMFREPKSCTAVQGDISPSGLCDYFKRKTKTSKLYNEGKTP